jgi:hypothetical protein
MTEQYVLRQLITQNDIAIFYWAADNAKSEIDLLVQAGHPVLFYLLRGARYRFPQLYRYRIMKVIRANEAWQVLKGIQWALFPCLLFTSFSRVEAQPEVEPWGNMNGIRVDGQLMEFESSLRLIGTDGTILNATAKEMQNPHYSREGKVQIINSHLDSLYFKETVEETGAGAARLRFACTAHGDMKLRGVYFSVELPEDLSEGGAQQWIDPSPGSLQRLSPELRDALYSAFAGGIRIFSSRQQVEIHLDEPALITGTLVERAGHSHLRIDIPIQSGNLQKDQSGETALSITTDGSVDRTPIHLALNTAVSGRPFDGLGGNFRIQNPKLDPQVIDYCLQNLRVAWGRVELPWRFWQPVKNSEPLDAAKAGKLHPAVQRAMDMVRMLSEKKIPFILSAWFPPDWAIVGPIHFSPGPDHIWGNPLNKDSTEAIYKSITDYILLLKERYKVEPKYFSFNESDLGINVRQTGREHDELIKGLGAYFARYGLATRVLLGDNSDATTYAFVDPAINDPAARRYIQAISFHSWRGCDSATLHKWADDATRLRVPLLVAEGSIDAAAWAYPAILQEQTYALREITLYTLLLSICQPASILQWQLTTDYSLLAGGGIFGDTSALRPTQRFWNLKQLSMTPRGLFAMPLSCDRPNVTVAALGSNERHLYALHLVNNGAAREVILTGLPLNVKALHIYTTNMTESVKEGTPVKVTEGRAQFTLEAQSYVLLMSE